MDSTMAGIRPNTAAAFVAGLQLQSAAARLMAAGVRIDLGRNATISIPHAATATPLPVFIAEGAPIAVAQPQLTSGTLGPLRRMVLIEALTNELAEHSFESAQTVISTIMTEAASRALDAAVFSTPADATRPRVAFCTMSRRSHQRPAGSLPRRLTSRPLSPGLPATAAAGRS